MTSRPLLTRVAEFVVTTRPMSHVGWASASAGVTSASDARERPRNGPPDAVSTSRRTSDRVARAQRLGDRGVLGVDGDDLARLRDRGHEIAADDQGLLVREREGAAALECGERRAEAHGAGDAVEHHVGLDIAHELLGLVGAERGELDLELLGLRLHRLAMRTGRQPDHLETPRIRADHLESLSADRAGGTEDDDAAHEVRL